jgi:hypothetical protein
MGVGGVVVMGFFAAAVFALTFLVTRQKRE